MEVHVGLGRVYGRPPGKTFRGAFQSLFQSVREAFHSPGGGAREEPGGPQAAAAASSSSSSASGPASAAGARESQPGSSPTYLPLEQPPAGSKGLEAAASALPLGPPPFPACPGDLKELLLAESGPPQPPQQQAEAEGAPAAKEDFLGESAKELCKAVSASMGLAVEALEAPGGGGCGELLPARGDCMFALPGAAPRPLPPLATCKIVEAAGEGGEAGGRAGAAGEGGALALDVAGPLSLYKGSPELDEPPAAFPARDYYNFQLALAPHGRIKLESPLDYAAAAGGGGGVWGAQCRRAAELPALAPHYGGPPWHPFFADDGQLYGPCPAAAGEGAAANPFAYGRSPAPAGHEGGELPAELWYPGGVVGRVPFAPAAAAGCIKTELSPWLEGYAGAYGDVREAPVAFPKFHHSSVFTTVIQPPFHQLYRQFLAIPHLL
ncbi:UNVERIFIED_CONTAM: hypothetical protein K2H54_053538 [Gekko kuhli]